MNKYAQGYDKIATGHNMDDELQSFVMNLIKNSPALIARQGPLVGVQKLKGFTPRIKPLMMVNEREVRIYAFIKGFQLHFSECPYAYMGFRNGVRDWLNAQELAKPGTKEQLLNTLIGLLPKLKSHFKQNSSLPIQTDKALLGMLEEVKQCSALTSDLNRY